MLPAQSKASSKPNLEFQYTKAVITNESCYNLSVSSSPWRTQNLHYWVSSALLAALVPLLIRLHLPVRFDWTRLLSLYWLVLTSQSVFLAALLFAISAPYEQALGPFLERMRGDKRRIILIAVFMLILWWASTGLKALLLTVDAVVLMEFLERTRAKERRPALEAIFVPALYLFICFLLVFAYNDVVLSVRFFAQNDPALSSADKWLMHGRSVSDICHWAARRFPDSFFQFLHLVYVGMFPQVGATLAITSLRSGKGRGLQFVGAIVTSYYIALLLFYLWPSQGPYYLCANHFSQLPKSVPEYTMQMRSIANSEALFRGLRISWISTDYYIAFPCMHIVQPLIVLWFLRHWRPAVLVLAAYDVVLLAAILFLEWHYLVDILAAVPVAALAITAVDRAAFWSWVRCSGRTGMS